MNNHLSTGRYIHKKCADLPYLRQACDSLKLIMEKSAHRTHTPNMSLILLVKISLEVAVRRRIEQIKCLGVDGTERTKLRRKVTKKH